MYPPLLIFIMYLEKKSCTRQDSTKTAHWTLYNQSCRSLCIAVRFLSGMSGIELADRVLKECSIVIETKDYDLKIDYPAEYWCGWALAYYQWRSGKSFRQIRNKISFESLEKLYPSSWAVSRTFLRSLSETPGLPLRAMETEASETADLEAPVF